jgi:hypothetical protein
LTSSVALKGGDSSRAALKGGDSSRAALKGGDSSRAALKGGDSSRDLRSRCRFAVHQPGNPEASPRSHGMPCRGSVPSGADARLVLADGFNVSVRTDILGEVKRRFPRH